MRDQKQTIKIGVGIMVLKDGKALIGKRKGDGFGEYAWPGGHLEYMESIVDGAKREVLEEAGIAIYNVRFLRLANFKRSDKHYIDIALVADWKSGEPKTMEPEKCEGWEWRDLDDLPLPLFPTIPSYLEALKTGKNFFDN